MKFEFIQTSEFLEKDALMCMRQSNMSGLGRKVKGQLDLWCYIKPVSQKVNIFRKYYDFRLNSYIEK